MKTYQLSYKMLKTITLPWTKYIVSCRCFVLVWFYFSYKLYGGVKSTQHYLYRIRPWCEWASKNACQSFFLSQNWSHSEHNSTFTLPLCHTKDQKMTNLRWKFCKLVWYLLIFSIWFKVLNAKQKLSLLFLLHIQSIVYSISKL